MAGATIIRKPRNGPKCPFPHVCFICHRVIVEIGIYPRISSPDRIEWKPAKSISARASILHAAKTQKFEFVMLPSDRLASREKSLSLRLCLSSARYRMRVEIGRLPRLSLTLSRRFGARRLPPSLLPEAGAGLSITIAQHAAGLISF